MTDRELLECAAKAAGYQFVYVDELEPHIKSHGGGTEYWNPLADDGDALRLAVKLRFKVDTDFRVNPFEAPGTGVWLPGDKELYPPFWTAAQSDAANATRRTIVRAAAEIGKAMQ